MSSGLSLTKQKRLLIKVELNVTRTQFNITSLIELSLILRGVSSFD
jgi:hypothetical protein